MVLCDVPACVRSQSAASPQSLSPAHGRLSDAYVEGVIGVAPADETTVALTKALGEILGYPVRLTWMGARHRVGGRIIHPSALCAACCQEAAVNDVPCLAAVRQRRPLQTLAVADTGDLSPH